VLKARDARSALCAKGFREDDSRHHCFYFFYFEGRKSSEYTKISHNATDLDDFLCGAMAKQIRLTKKQFISLVDCNIDAEAYAKLLVETGHIRPNPPKEAVPRKQS
jgi:hypothetical protein